MAGEQTVFDSEVNEADYDDALRLVRVLSAFGLIVATLGLATVPLGIERFHYGSPVGQWMVQFYNDAVVSTSLDAWWLLLGTFGWLGLCTLLFFGCIGTVLLKGWARRAMLGWAVAALGMGAISSFFYFRWLIPPTREAVGEVRGDVDSLIMFYVWALSSVLAVGVLICFNRRDVRRYFGRG